MAWPQSLAPIVRERLLQAATTPEVRAIARGARTSFAISGEGWSLPLAVVDGTVTEAPGPAAPAFDLVASDGVWRELLADQPSAGNHSLVHLVRVGTIVVHGSQLEYERMLQIARALVEAARDHRSHAPIGRPLDATGSYRRVSTSLGTSDIYVERAGQGYPVLAFATAGSDTSQWHGLMTHSDLTERFELISVDLPWHGRSSPAWGEVVGGYRLTPASYTEFILAMADALKLEHPVLLGVSMGGAAVVHAIATHRERFAGAVSCQAAASVAARANEHLRGTQLNSALFVPEWSYGLMNPRSPEEFKRRVWWGYSSGGFGVYAADIDSYLSWNFNEVEHLLTPASPHIAVLSGSFDTSVPSECSRELAQRIPNASFERMPELGHFPHAENPAVFAKYLEAALERVFKEMPPRYCSDGSDTP